LCISLVEKRESNTFQKGHTWNECDQKKGLASVRSAEARRACALLGAHFVFLDQPYGATAVGCKAYQQFNELMGSLNQDLVFAHWPIDTHRDHRSAWLLAYQAWECSERKFLLAYYEVMTGIQTHQFQPNWYVDISDTWPAKREACYTHTSQKPERF